MHPNTGLKNQSPAVDGAPRRGHNGRGSVQVDAVDRDYESIGGEPFFVVRNSHQMAPFFMALVSGSDHWLYVASNGALSAGRRDPSRALFPYYSADKILDTRLATGPRTIVRVGRDSMADVCWEPFGYPDVDSQAVQNVYKNLSGTRILFEEIHAGHQLMFRYGWTSSRRFGFVRECSIQNLADQPVRLKLADGLKNVLPACLDDQFQLRFSNLADAYKRQERLLDQNLGVYYLSSIPSDRAEPNEGLRSTVCWQIGMHRPKILLCEEQIALFRDGVDVESESEIRGRRGDFWLVDDFLLAPGATLNWTVLANVHQTQADVVALRRMLSATPADVLAQQVADDVAATRRRLDQWVSAADGFQCGSRRRRVHRHRSNVTFNIMRGGVPVDGYRVSKTDFQLHLARANRSVAERFREWCEALPESIEWTELVQSARQQNDLDLTRLTAEFLPLTFSRRHGDPTRPWNRFTIDVESPNGAPKVYYEGNWRDLFQNWEALGWSFPEFLPGMILRFVNASTADGFNPYRITSCGLDWERPDPADPWSNIGYWGDHQIVYLMRLLQAGERFVPEQIRSMLNEPVCTHANVPYRIVCFDRMLANPKSTIEFDAERDSEIDQRVRELGFDGRLLLSEDRQLVRSTLAEKLVLPAVVKLANLIPDAGIWLNTQRPEWNDANNALVGQGASMVTVCYLRQYLSSLVDLLEDSGLQQISMHAHLKDLIERVQQVYESIVRDDPGRCDGAKRFHWVEQLQRAFCRYRTNLYKQASLGALTSISVGRLIGFAKTAVAVLDRQIENNRRDDYLYHSYNLVSFENEMIDVVHLDEMLEGQVAVLASGAINAAQTIELLTALRQSRLFSDATHSYLLYPNRELPRFLDKNQIDPDRVMHNRLVRTLLEQEDDSIVVQDVEGNFRFAADLRNRGDLESSLDQLSAAHPEWARLIADEREVLGTLYEQTFEHHRYTGRSGTFFAYEGLGSVYWHMVSKLALAIEELAVDAWDSGQTDLAQLLTGFYRSVRNGLGAEYKPEQHGAIPVDPYSHTPEFAGARQPGMTGQVKEDILARWHELGLRIHGGCLRFNPGSFEWTEAVRHPVKFEYVDRDGQVKAVPLHAGQFGFTFCQVPIVYEQGDQNEITIHRSDAEVRQSPELELTREESRALFGRTGQIEMIRVVWAS